MYQLNRTILHIQLYTSHYILTQGALRHGMHEILNVLLHSLHSQKRSAWDRLFKARFA